MVPSLYASGQNLRCKKIPANQKILLDTIAIEPGSITSDYPVAYIEASQFIEVRSEIDSVEVCYRILSEFLTQTFQNRDIATYDELDGEEPIMLKSTPLEKEELFELHGVQKYGTISRGISFGSRQSVFVKSSLNLQMNGQIADNLNVSAVITDQNIPYQPEGNTQHIRDFDNVFIKLYNENFDVTAGDIVLGNDIKEDYFLKYYKNVQGLQLAYRKGTKDWHHSTKVSGALSKGKFASTLLESIEGLSGPYKLTGPNGERFIIVLANSEKVFLDGKQMERGFDRDYIIDYNLGEISFNNHLVITRFSRIRVDFEYAEQFYSRSNFSLAQTVEHKNIKMYAGFYRAHDNPNANFGFVLHDDDLSQLQAIGDQTDQAFVSGLDAVSFDENRILYRQVDTLDRDGNPQTVFAYSANPTDELFAASFSDVGIGNGNYMLRQTSSNGRIYEWISPRRGSRQGRYQLGSFIPLPDGRQMMTLGGEVKISEYETIFSAGAFSNADVNLYSSLDDHNNDGAGYYGGIRSDGRGSFLDGYNWLSSLSVEVDTKHFSAIDRYRPVAFDRNWDLDLDTIAGSSDFIFFGKTSLYKNTFNEISYEVNRRCRKRIMDGWQQSVTYNQEAGDFQLKSIHSYLEGKQGDQASMQSKWIKSRSDVSFNRFKIVPGYVFHIDENTLSKKDSVINSRMHFHANEWYVTNGDSTSGSYRVSYLVREDRAPVHGEIKDFLFSRNVNANYTIKGVQSNVSADFNYRSVEDKSGLHDAEQEDIVSGRINWWGSYFQKHLVQNFSFSTGNSRELKREFVYVPVNTGEGTHAWRDLNEDGIQDLSEFFEAINPDERNFVKIFTPTDDYITSFQTFYTHSIDARTPISWKRQGGLKAFLGNFSINVNFNITFKTTSESYENRLNPFALTLDDTDVLAGKGTRRYTLFFNKNGRGFAGDFAYQSSDNKQLLTQGFEARDRDEWITNLKIDLSGEYTLRLSSTIGTLANKSDFLNSRNFDIASHAYTPQLIWQPSQTFRLIGSYGVENKQNKFSDASMESSQIQRYNGELTWNQPGKGSLRSSFSWININFTGEQTTYLAYLLLDALQPGTNQTWQMNWQQKLSRGMQLSLLYNGRKSENTSSIHTGSVQVTAFF